MKPDLLVVGPLHAPTLDTLESNYTTHKLWLAADRAGFLAGAQALGCQRPRRAPPDHGTVADLRSPGRQRRAGGRVPDDLDEHHRTHGVSR